MPGKKDDLQEGFHRFEFRNGFNGFAWRGIVSEGDASSIPANAVRMAVNARIVGGEYRERAGLDKLFSTELGSNAHSILDIVPYDPVRPLKLWFTGAGCPGLSPGFGFSLGSIDQEQDPEIQRNVYYSGAGATSLVFAKFNGRLYVGAGADFSEYQYIRQPWGIEAIAVSGSSQNTPIMSFAGYTITCMLEFDGRLWIGLDGGAGLSKIATYDGVSIKYDKTAIDPPTCMALYRIQNGGDALVVGTSTSNNIHIRPTGTTATWSAIGSVASVKMISYKDVLYIATGSTAIYSWNGVALASVHVPTNSTVVRTLERFNGFLYFGYSTLLAAIIGKFDGTTWTDVERNLTTLLAGTIIIRAMAAYRGFLVASGTRNGLGRLWASPLTDTSGTWTQLAPTTGGVGIEGGTIFDMLVA